MSPHEDIIIYDPILLRYPIKLDVGIHTLKIPVRLKGPGVIKCSVKTSTQQLEIHTSRMFKPDLVDGNLFSSFISIPITNQDSERNFELEKIRIKEHSIPGLKNVDIKLLNQAPIQPGQTSSIIFEVMYFSNQEQQQKCPNRAIAINLEIVSTKQEKREILIELRCRSSEQSVLFTFLDHDGSVQHAAAIKPLKDCLNEKCPVVLSNHGTGKCLYFVCTLPCIILRDGKDRKDGIAD